MRGSRLRGSAGKKARDRLAMKLQCYDLTAVFLLVRLCDAFCSYVHANLFILELNIFNVANATRSQLAKLF